MLRQERLECTKRSLAEHLNFSSQKMLDENPRIQPQAYKTVLILDLEATCLQKARIDPQEIIEIACTAVSFDTTEEKEESESFFEIVRPIARPRLSPFCTKLTGITQKMVDAADDFTTVFDRFQVRRKT